MKELKSIFGLLLLLVEACALQGLSRVLGDYKLSRLLESRRSVTPTPQERIRDCDGRGAEASEFDVPLTRRRSRCSVALAI